MLYSNLCAIYEDLEQNPSRLKKTEILKEFLKPLKKEKADYQMLYLLEGKVFPDYDEREFGISEQLCIKALAKSSGISKEEIISKWKKIGDLGLVAEQIISTKNSNCDRSKYTRKCESFNIKDQDSFDSAKNILHKNARIGQ